MKQLFKLVLCIIPLLGASQEDNILWASVTLKAPLSETVEVNLKPIFRYDDDISTYLNMSMEGSVKKKFNKGWSVQFLARTWFIPDATNRQFLWLDVGHGFPIKKVKVNNRLRYHWALDIKDRIDPDFLRWITKISLDTGGKITPYLGIEPWYRLNGENQFQRIRYEPGIVYKISNSVSLDLQYRRENNFNVPVEGGNNLYVVNLIYTLTRSSKKDTN
ncbi:MAG: DUF2490 domain-containing protein [Bacteroidia bacterium]|nr:DUF2490 domain-containing protein [Bacteroidia bacterium]